MALRKTLENRPDLLEKAELTKRDRKILEELRLESDRMRHPSS
jgi:tRNA (guanine37-N1)-methyltransferase